MTYITNVFHMTVEPRLLEEFKCLIAEIVDLSSKEPGTLNARKQHVRSFGGNSSLSANLRTFSTYASDIP